MIRFLLTGFLILLLTACSTVTPPREFSPSGDIVKKAIALQLKITEQAISEQLSTQNPNFSINQVTVEVLEPVYIGQLPTYHLQGKYNLTLNLPSQERNQQNNEFEIYIQRQLKGQTWRLLKQEMIEAEKKVQWRSYLIDR